MAPTHRVAIVLLAALLACPSCRDQHDPERYVGNWRGPDGDILITPSKAIRLRSGRVTTGGVITGWKDDDPIVEFIPLLFSAERTFDLSAPYLEGDVWKLRWGEQVLVRLPDHAPFAAPFDAASFDVAPPWWDARPELERSPIPADRRALIGHWRGLGLDILIAENGQARGEVLAPLQDAVFDGTIDRWTDGGFRIVNEDGEHREFSVDAMPQADGPRRRAKINGIPLTLVFDHTPAGERGAWVHRAQGNELHGQCVAGSMVACLGLSRDLGI